MFIFSPDLDTKPHLNTSSQTHQLIDIPKVSFSLYLHPKHLFSNADDDDDDDVPLETTTPGKYLRVREKVWIPLFL